MPFPRVLGQKETQTVSSRIRILIADSNFNEKERYAKHHTLQKIYLLKAVK